MWQPYSPFSFSFRRRCLAITYASCARHPSVKHRIAPRTFRPTFPPAGQSAPGVPTARHNHRSRFRQNHRNGAVPPVISRGICRSVASGRATRSESLIFELNPGGRTRRPAPPRTPPLLSAVLARNGQRRVRLFHFLSSTPFPSPCFCVEQKQQP